MPGTSLCPGLVLIMVNPSKLRPLLASIYSHWEIMIPTLCTSIHFHPASNSWCIYVSHTASLFLLFFCKHFMKTWSAFLFCSILKGLTSEGKPGHRDSCDPALTRFLSFLHELQQQALFWSTYMNFRYPSFIINRLYFTALGHSVAQCYRHSHTGSKSWYLLCDDMETNLFQFCSQLEFSWGCFLHMAYLPLQMGALSVETILHKMQEN